jgi:hypothetical protein
LVADRTEHVVHDPAGWERVVHVVRDHPEDVERAGQRDELPDEFAFLRETVVPALDGEPPLEDVEQRRRRLAGSVRVARRQAPRDPARGAAGECKEAARVRRQRVERHGRLATEGVHARARDERGDIAVPLARLGENDQVRARVVGQDGELCPDDPADAEFAGGLREAHSAAQVVVVGQGKRGHA